MCIVPKFSAPKKRKASLYNKTLKYCIKHPQKFREFGVIDGNIPIQEQFKQCVKAYKYAKEKNKKNELESLIKQLESEEK